MQIVLFNTENFGSSDQLQVTLPSGQTVRHHTRSDAILIPPIILLFEAWRQLDTSWSTILFYDALCCFYDSMCCYTHCLAKFQAYFELADVLGSLKLPITTAGTVTEQSNPLSKMIRLLIWNSNKTAARDLIRYGVRLRCCSLIVALADGLLKGTLLW